VVSRTTKITVETDTRMVIRNAKAVRAWCPGCNAEVTTITMTDASLLEPATAAHLQRWLSTGKLHLSQPATGPAQICVPSLLQSFDLDDGETFSRLNENPLVK
jgi:hypothetical protein